MYSWSVKEMGFLMYKRDDSWNCIFAMLIIRLIHLYSFVLDYLHGHTNSNERIKDQLGSLYVNISEGVLGCFADLKMMFVMYQKAPMTLIEWRNSCFK